MEKLGFEVAGMHRGYPKEVILRDGTGVTLRPLSDGDEVLLRDFFLRLPAEERWFLDRDQIGPGSVQGWTRDREEGRAFPMVAILEGRVVSHALLLKRPAGPEAHVAQISIAVDPAFREKHLGTWMLLDLINKAVSLGVEILVMHLVEVGDPSVMRAAKRLQFSRQGVLRSYLKDRGGAPHNLVIMVKRLERGWGDTVP